MGVRVWPGHVACTWESGRVREPASRSQEEGSSSVDRERKANDVKKRCVNDSEESKRNRSNYQDSRVASDE